MKDILDGAITMIPFIFTALIVKYTDEKVVTGLTLGLVMLLYWKLSSKGKI